MRSTGRELIDGPVQSRQELEGSFRDIEAANRWLGGFRALCATVLSRDGIRTVLDVGTGSADMPRALVRAARSRGKALSITCTDANPAMLDVARSRGGNDSSLTFAREDGTALSFETASFDAAMCNLSLHHFDEPSAVRLLSELRRVSRVTPVVTDLRRSRVAWALAWILSRIYSRNRLTRHDAPMSVLRAYTPAEAIDLARRAGWRGPRVRRVAFFRMVLTDES